MAALASDVDYVTGVDSGSDSESEVTKIKQQHSTPKKKSTKAKNSKACGSDSDTDEQVKTVSKNKKKKQVDVPNQNKRVLRGKNNISPTPKSQNLNTEDKSKSQQTETQAPTLSKTDQKVQTDETYQPTCSNEYIQLRAQIKTITYILLTDNKLSAAKKENIHEALNAIDNCAMELELKATADKAKASQAQESLKVLSKLSTHTKALTHESPLITPSPQKSYAAAVKEASATLIVKAHNNNNTVAIKEKLNKVDCHNIAPPREVKTMKTAIIVKCNNNEEALKLKEKILETNGNREELKITSGSYRRKKIIIYHTPASTTSETVRLALLNTLQLQDDSLINVKNPITTKIDSHHWPVDLPLEAAIELINKNRTIYIGMKKCPIKSFVQLTRCFRCQAYDHVAARCNEVVVCARCCQQHSTEHCNNNNLQCRNCTTMNKNLHEVSKVNTNHAAGSKSCSAHAELFRCRQIASSVQGRPTKVTASDVFAGRVRLGQDREGREILQFALPPSHRSEASFSPGSQAPRYPSGPQAGSRPRPSLRC